MNVTDQTQLKKINAMLEEISLIKSKIELHQEAIKDIITTIHEEHDLEKPLIRKLAKVYHARNFIEEVANNEEFVEAYEQLVSAKNRLDSK